MSSAHCFLAHALKHNVDQKKCSKLPKYFTVNTSPDNQEPRLVVDIPKSPASCGTTTNPDHIATVGYCFEKDSHFDNVSVCGCKCDSSATDMKSPLGLNCFPLTPPPSPILKPSLEVLTWDTLVDAIKSIYVPRQCPGGSGSTETVTNAPLGPGSAGDGAPGKSPCSSDEADHEKEGDQPVDVDRKDIQPSHQEQSKEAASALHKHAAVLHQCSDATTNILSKPIMKCTIALSPGPNGPGLEHIVSFADNHTHLSLFCNIRADLTFSEGDLKNYAEGLDGKNTDFLEKIGLGWIVECVLRWQNKSIVNHHFSLYLAFPRYWTLSTVDDNIVEAKVATIDARFLAAVDVIRDWLLTHLSPAAVNVVITMGNMSCLDSVVQLTCTSSERNGKIIRTADVLARLCTMAEDVKSGFYLCWHLNANTCDSELCGGDEPAELGQVPHQEGYSVYLPIIFEAIHKCLASQLGHAYLFGTPEMKRLADFAVDSDTLTLDSLRAVQDMDDLQDRENHNKRRTGRAELESTDLHDEPDSPSFEKSLMCEFLSGNPFPTETLKVEDQMRSANWHSLLLLGAAGMGKTVAMRRAASVVSEGVASGSLDRIVLFAEARQLARLASESTPETFLQGLLGDLVHIAVGLARIESLELAPSHVKELLDRVTKGKKAVSILIDGLDEIGQGGERATFLDRLLTVAQEHPRIRVCVSSRVACLTASDNTAVLNNHEIDCCLLRLLELDRKKQCALLRKLDVVEQIKNQAREDPNFDPNNCNIQDPSCNIAVLRRDFAERFPSMVSSPLLLTLIFNLGGRHGPDESTSGTLCSRTALYSIALGPFGSVNDVASSDTGADVDTDQYLMDSDNESDADEEKSLLLPSANASSVCWALAFSLYEKAQVCVCGVLLTGCMS